MNSAVVFLVAVGVGFFSGLRAFTPLALVSWMSIWGWMPLAGSPLWFVGTITFAVIVSFLAIGELIGDKLPKIPPRIEVGPLSARAVTAALSSGAVCFCAGRSWAFGIFFGGIGSFVGAMAGYHARRFLVQRLHIPDLVVALMEDFVAIAGTLFLLRRFFGTPV